MSLQKQEPEDVQPFGITLIAAFTAIVPLVILLRGTAYSISVLSAALGVVAGAGLFFQKSWARWLTIFYYAASLVLLVVQKTTVLFLALGSILPLVIIGYLFLPGVVASFSPKKSA